jgi:hypothetical protein
MKLLLILCPGERADEVRALIDRHEVHGYTEIPELRGSGITGLHLGTRAYPGAVCLIFTAVAEPKAAELIAALREHCRECDPAEGLRAFVLNVQEMI